MAEYAKVYIDYFTHDFVILKAAFLAPAHPIILLSKNFLEVG